MPLTRKSNDSLLDVMRMVGDSDADKMVKDLVASGCYFNVDFYRDTVGCEAAGQE